MQIFMRFQYYDSLLTQIFEVELDTTVLELKGMAAQLLNNKFPGFRGLVTARMCSLSYGGKTLENERTLEDYNISKEVTLLCHFKGVRLDANSPPMRAIPVGTSNAISFEDIKTGNIMTNFYGNSGSESGFGRYYRKNTANQLNRHPQTRGSIESRINYVADVMGPIKPESSGGRRTRRRRSSRSSRKTRRH
jgi:hypothetical protein